MKRIAICMRGAVSKHSLSNDPGYFYTPDSVYQDKPYINLNIVYDSIKKYIIKAVSLFAELVINLITNYIKILRKYY